MQGVKNSELGYVPARQTTLLHRGARKADSGSMARKPPKNLLLQGIENSELGYVPARPLCSIAVRARRTVALKNPQLMDNATSDYRKQPSGPNLVTPAA